MKTKSEFRTSSDFQRPIAGTSIRKVSGVDRVKSIRLYPEFTGGRIASEWRWCLQVRGPETLASHRDGAAFIVASASLPLEDLRALHAQIGALLAAQVAK